MRINFTGMFWWQLHLCEDSFGQSFRSMHRHGWKNAVCELLLKYLQFPQVNAYLLPQWAALSTHLSLMRVPPQNMLALSVLPELERPTCHPTSPLLAFWPPTTLVPVFTVFKPHLHLMKKWDLLFTLCEEEGWIRNSYLPPLLPPLVGGGGVGRGGGGRPPPPPPEKQELAWGTKARSWELKCKMQNL